MSEGKGKQVNIPVLFMYLMATESICLTPRARLTLVILSVNIYMRREFYNKENFVKGWNSCLMGNSINAWGP